ncbi:MAG TPA: ATP-binding protein [Cyanophyceae cyanobacterium]
MNNNLTPLPPDYNTTEYAHIEILESGDVDIWLRRRGQLLIEKAKDTARECEAGKLASIAVVGVSAVLSANPLMWIPLSIGASGYLWTLFTEYQDTGAIKPIPLYRGRLGNLLGILEGQRGEEAHPLLEQIAYLSEQDKDEVLLLRYRFGQIAGVLGAVPPRTRFDLYRHIVEQYHARQILIERDEINAYLASAVSEARRAMPAQDKQKPALPTQPVVPALQEPTVSSTNNQQPITNNSPLPPEQWTPDLMGYPSILIYGAQGAGKTSTAAWLIGERIKVGHQIKILDPHRSYGQWDGLECIGDGMDYEAINDELKAFTEEIKARYKTRAKTPNYDPPKLTLVCDEFTQWAKKCSHSATFFEESLTDIRKINLHVLFISHARTLTGLGGSNGLAAARDAGLLELELEAQVDPQTKKASPKLLGWLKYPGVAMNERQRVAIASWMNGSMNFSGSGVAPTAIQKPVTTPQAITEQTPEQEAIAQGAVPEAIAQPETTTELKVSDSLGEPLKSIWLFAKKKGDWVTAKDVYVNGMAVLKGKGVKQIRQYFGLLADSGFGEVDEMDGEKPKSDSSVGFRTN